MFKSILKTNISKKNKNRVKELLLPVLKFVFAISLLYWVVNKSDINFQSFRNIIDLELIFVVLILTTLMLLFNNWRWWVLLQARKFDLSFFESLRLTFIGLFFNFVVPGSVGGDLIKGYYVCRQHNQRKVEAGFTIIVDRLVGLFVMLNMGILGIILSWKIARENPLILKMFGIMVTISILIISLAIVFFLYDKKLETGRFAGGRICKMYPVISAVLSGVSAYRKNIRALLSAVVLSFIGQILSVFIFMYIGYRLEEVLPFETHLFVVALGFITSSIPLTPGGVGVGQVAFYFFFKLYTGQNLQVGALGITIMQLFMFSLGLLGGLLYLRGVKARVETVYD